MSLDGFLKYGNDNTIINDKILESLRLENTSVNTVRIALDKFPVVEIVLNEFCKVKLAAGYRTCSSSVKNSINISSSTRDEDDAGPQGEGNEPTYSMIQLRTPSAASRTRNEAGFNDFSPLGRLLITSVAPS